MPYDDSENNMRLFAAEVLPALRRLPASVLVTGEDVEPADTRQLALGF